MDLAYPPRIPLAQTPTPLVPLPVLTESHGRGHRLWVKCDDLTGSALSGNKVRKLEFVIAAAREEDCDTLITCGGVQSNHCRATALVGARLGFRVHLILREDTSPDCDGNLLLGHLAGAEVTSYSPRDYSGGLDGLFELWRNRYEADGGRVFCIPTGASDGIGVWGYIDAARELRDDLEREGIERAHVICATGSGGTQAGLTLGAALYDMPVTVWGVNVCDDEAWFLNKVAEDIADWSRRHGHEIPDRGRDVRVIDGYVGPGYGRAGPEVFDTIGLVARREGMVLDPVYTGKAFHAMLEQIAAGRFEACRDIVFMHTGGVFGLFPQRDQLAAATSK